MNHESRYISNRHFLIKRRHEPLRYALKLLHRNLSIFTCSENDIDCVIRCRYSVVLLWQAKHHLCKQLPSLFYGRNSGWKFWIKRRMAYAFHRSLYLDLKYARLYLVCLRLCMHTLAKNYLSEVISSEAARQMRFTRDDTLIEVCTIVYTQVPPLHALFSKIYLRWNFPVLFYQSLTHKFRVKLSFRSINYF